MEIISGIVGDAPQTLNTLGKLANAIYKRLTVIQNARSNDKYKVSVKWYSQRLHEAKALKNVLKLDRQRPRIS